MNLFFSSWVDDCANSAGGCRHRQRFSVMPWEQRVTFVKCRKFDVLNFVEPAIRLLSFPND